MQIESFREAFRNRPLLGVLIVVSTIPPFLHFRYEAPNLPWHYIIPAWILGTLIGLTILVKLVMPTLNWLDEKFEKFVERLNND
jgi:hypothetical protein